MKFGWLLFMNHPVSFYSTIVLLSSVPKLIRP